MHTHLLMHSYAFIHMHTLSIHAHTCTCTQLQHILTWHAHTPTHSYTYTCTQSHTHSCSLSCNIHIHSLSLTQSSLHHFLPSLSFPAFCGMSANGFGSFHASHDSLPRSILSSHCTGAQTEPGELMVPQELGGQDLHLLFDTLHGQLGAFFVS